MKGSEVLANPVAISKLAGKRILFLLHWMEIGGAENQALFLAEFLKTQVGAHVEIWGLEEPGRVAEISTGLGIACRQVPFSFDRGPMATFVSLVRYAAKLRQHHPDILLPYTMYPNLIAGLLWRVAGARGCVWQQRDEGRSRRKGVLEKWVLDRTPLFIANSSASFEFLQQSLGVSSKRIRMVMNGIKLPVVKTTKKELRLRLGLDESSLVGCMVANLHLYKDHETLLHAWRIVVDELTAEGIAPVLLLAGRFDNTYEKLKALVAELGLAHQVRFLGYVKEIADLLAAVDIGLFSSKYEGCPNSVLECMFSGLAVAATDIPGARDALGDEGLPMLSPPGDHRAFAKILLRLLRDPTLRQREGERNRRRAMQVFGLERMCCETAEVIAGLLDVQK